MTQIPSPVDAIVTASPIEPTPNDFVTSARGSATADLALRLVTGGSAGHHPDARGADRRPHPRALPSIERYGFGFITSTTWRPNEIERPLRDAAGKLQLDEDGERVMETVPPSFGALPVIYGTAVSSLIALAFAVPLSVGAAIFLVRVAARPAGGWSPGSSTRLFGVGIFMLVSWVAGGRGAT